jgi:WD40 repeat protein
MKIKTANGTLEITLDDPAATVTVDGTDIVVSGIQGVKEFRLKAGDYTAHLTRDGKPQKTEVVSIKRGEKTPLRVTFEGDGRAAAVAYDGRQLLTPADHQNQCLACHTAGAPEDRGRKQPWCYADRAEINRFLAANQFAHASARVTQPQRSFPTDAGEVSSAVFSADGSNLFVADWKGTVYAYDFASGKVRFAAGKSGGSRFLAVSPDQTALAVVGTDQTVRLLDQKGRLKRSLDGKCAPYYAVAFTADGKTLAAGGCGPDGRGGLLELWDLESGEARTLKFADAVTSLAVPPGHEDRVAVGTAGDNVRMIYPSTRKEEYSLRQPGPIRSLAFAPDGNLLAASSDTQVHVWDWGSSREIATLTGHAGRVTTAQFSPDGKRLLTASLDGTAKLWDVQSGKCAATIAPGKYKTGMGVAVFTPDGKSIVTAGDDGQIRVWDVAAVVAGQAGATHFAGVAGLSDIPYLNQLFQNRLSAERDAAEAARAQAEANLRAAKEAEARARASAPATQSRRNFPTDAHEVSSAVLSKDGTQLYVADWSGNLYGHDLATGNTWFTIAATKYGLHRFLAVSPDGNTLASVGTEQLIHLWDLKTGKLRNQLRGQTEPYYAVAFSPDGKTLAAGGRSPRGDGGIIELWDFESGRSRTIEFPDAVRSLAFPPGRNDRLVVGTVGANVRVFDVASGEKKYVVLQPGPIRALAFSPDGRSLAASSVRNQVHISDWQPERDAAMHRGTDNVTGGDSRVTALQFSPDGNRFVIASLDGTAQLWQFRPGAGVLATFAPGTYKAGMGAALFTPDGKSLITAGDDRMIRIWDLPAFKTAGQPVATPPLPPPPARPASEPPSAASAPAKPAEPQLRGGNQVTQPQRTFEANAGGPIRVAAFSPDARTLYIAGDQRPVQEFNLQDGAVSGSTAGRWGDAPLVAVAPDGQTLATGGARRPVTVWDARTGQQRGVDLADGAVATVLAFGPDGKMLAIGGRRQDRKGFVQLTNLERSETRTIEFPFPVLSLAIDLAGQKCLAVGLDADNVRIVEIQSAKELYQMHLAGPIPALAFSPDGRFLAAGFGNGQVDLSQSPNAWRVAMHRGPKLAGHKSRVTSVRFSPSNRLATASVDGTARLWEANTGRLLATFNPNAGNVNVAEISPDGKWLVTAGDDRVIRVWGLSQVIAGQAGPATRPAAEEKALDSKPSNQSGRIIHVDGSGAVRAAAFSGNGKSVVIAGEDRIARVYDVASGSLRYNFEKKSWQSPPILALAPDGNTFAMAEDGDIVSFWYIHSVKEHLPDLSTGVPTINALGFSRDGKTLAVGGTKADGKGVVALCDLQSGQNRKHEFTTPVLSLAFDPGDETRLAVGLEKQKVDVIHATTGEFICTTQLSGPTAHMAFSSEGKWIAATEGEYQVNVRNWNGGRIVARLTAGTGKVTSVRFSPNGKLLATASTDGIARLWGVPSGKLIGTFNANTGRLYVAEFSPDGKSLLTAGEGGVLRLWDLTSFLIERVPRGAPVPPPGQTGPPAGAPVLPPDETVPPPMDATVPPAGAPPLSAAAPGGAPVAPPPSANAPADSEKLLQTQIHLEKAASAANAAKAEANEQLAANFQAEARMYYDLYRTLLRDAAKGATAEAIEARAKALAPDQQFRQPWHTVPARTEGPVSSAVFGRQGDELIVSGSDGSIHAFDLFNGKDFSGKVRHSTDGKKGENRLLAVSVDGNLLASGGSRTVHLWDAKTGKAIRDIDGLNGVIDRMAFTPDGTTLVVATTGTEGGSIAFCNTATGAVKTLRLGPDRFVSALAVSPDGKLLAVGVSHFVLLFKTFGPYRDPIRIEQPFTVHAVAFSPDAATLAVANTNEVKLWDWKAENELRTLTGHADRVTGVEFAPAGPLLATSSRDGTVKLWASTTGRLVATFAPTGSGAKQTMATFAPHGQLLATGGEDGAVNLWHLIPFLVDATAQPPTP